MNSIIKIVLGTVITSVIPVLIIEIAKKKNWLGKNDFLNRNILYYIMLFCVIMNGNIFGNTEFIFTIILGSSILHILGISGVKFVLAKEEKNVKTWNHGMYYAFNCVLLLFLGADYLIKGNHSSESWFSTENAMSRADGIVLLFVLFFYLLVLLYYSKKPVEQDQNENDISFFQDKEKIKSSIIIWGLLLLLTFAGVLLLFSSFADITWKYHWSFYITSSVLGVWILNIPYIYQAMKKENKKEVILEESYIQGIVGLAGGIGCTAIIHPFWMSAKYIQDVMILCMIVIVMQFIKKLPSAIRGSFMITIYLAVIIGLFLR